MINRFSPSGMTRLQILDSEECGAFRRPIDRSRLVITTMMGMVFGYFISISSPYVSLTKISLPSNHIPSLALGDDHCRPSTEHFFAENLVTLQAFELVLNIAVLILNLDELDLNA
ncbi:hypothetical protein BC332_15496 [Capsicum chinense]|nr:hypothetical protein BC332_15496 [Capsicum chinense]